MNLITTIIVGGIIGWLASIVMKTNAQMGILANVIIGVVGAFMGGVIAGALGINGGGLVGGLIVGVAGAALLIAVLKRTGVLQRIPV
jgi:uncharacterized membrane protein YeaQ/YmgE (transglycosylase-associated protein family)